MSPVRRWVVVGLVVVVAAFVLGLVGGLTGTAPIEVVPAAEQT